MAAALARAALAAAALLLLAAAARAMNCTGTLSTDYAGDVYIANQSTCFVTDGVTISGSVYMSNGSNLETRGHVEILGSFGILGIGAGWLNLYGKTKVEKVDMLNGTADSHVSVYGAEIGLGGLKVENCKGDLKICGTVMLDVLEFKESRGDLIIWKDWFAVGGIGCHESSFKRDLKVEAIDGNVYIKEATVEIGELNVKDVLGTTKVESTSLAESKFELNVGEVSLNYVSGSITEIKENMGGVKMWHSALTSVTCVSNSPGVQGSDNSFGVALGQCSDPALTA